MAAVTDTTVRAAGGVLWRSGPAGRQVCLVHRPRHDDWSLPKGKLLAGEHPLVGAVREVAEETGVAGVPEARLPTIGYRLATGQPKSVDYWLMRAADGIPFTPNDEVDDLAWIPMAEAGDRLSYEHDSDVVRRAAELAPVTAVVVLLRHGYAGDRDQWTGPDRIRPLDEDGRRQAGELAPLLAVFRPGRLLAASPDRCAQTLDPLAGRVGLGVRVDRAFDEGTDPQVTVARLRELAAPGAPATVVCSQGKLIPGVLAALAGGPADGYATRKGDGWLLSFAGRDLAAMDRLSVTPT
jgi:8-oxo-dGTP diphosphatase